MIEYIKTEAITDLLIDEFPGHKVNSKVINGQQYYQIKRARSTVAILCVDPDFFADLSSVAEVRQQVKAKKIIKPLKQTKATVNIVLLAKHRVRMNHALSARDRKAGVFLDLLSNWQSPFRLPKFSSQRLPAVSIGRHVRFS
jgi:hypothetical protein